MYYISFSAIQAQINLVLRHVPYQVFHLLLCVLMCLDMVFVSMCCKIRKHIGVVTVFTQVKPFSVQWGLAHDHGIQLSLLLPAWSKLGCP